MPKDKEKLGFFKTILKSINDFDKYEDFALEKTGNSIKYALKLILVFSFVICIGFTYMYMKRFNEGFSYVKNELPYFKFEDNQLEFELEEAKIIESKDDNLSTAFIIDTKANGEEQDKYATQINSYNLCVLILKDKIVLIRPETSTKIEYNFSQVAKSYNLTNFDKNDFVQKIESINVALKYLITFAIVFVYLYPIYFISMMLDAIILAILARLVAMLSRINMKFSPSFNIGIHALTLSVILNMIYILVNLFTGFEIKYFAWMYNVISYIYVVVAILIIKSDLINRKLELIKLEEEKEKIKIELEKEERNKEEKKEKEKEKEEENKDDKNLKDSPEGSNA